VSGSSPVDLVLHDGAIQLPGGETVDGYLAVHDGTVVAVGEGAAPAARNERDCGGRLVLPGLIDIHTHFRDPGQTYKEDFRSGTAGAAVGGVTTVVDMPNTGTQVATADDFARKVARVGTYSYVDFGLHAVLVDSFEHIPALRALGVAGLKWLMGYDTWNGHRCQPSNHHELKRALELAAELDVLVGVHAEALDWMQDLKAALRAEGRNDVLAHPESRPPFVEAIAVAEACLLAADLGFRLHIHHLTSKRALQTVTALRAAVGGAVSVETCPVYLYLTQADVEERGPRVQVNPPIRSTDDQDALWAGLVAGTIDCVATDHAPHAESEKTASSIWEVQPGVIGVQTMFPLLFDDVASGRLSLRRFVEATAERPAQIVNLGHRKGSLLPGRDADVLVVDPSGTTTIRSAEMLSKQQFTPYDGWERRGAIDAVYLRGRQLVDRGGLVAEPFGAHAPSAYV
jgi:dihydroorotase (multifunctional complex type)